jgi:flavin reductase (DIM6/NTAB) family NADH-FMN oxidoreductase RutF
MTQAFDRLVARLDAAMVVVTTALGGERSGCLVGFHSQLSIDPRRYGVCVSKANHTFGVAMGASYVAVHALSEGDGEVAARFGALTGDDVDKFAPGDWQPGPDGVPLLNALPNRLVGRVLERVDVGDHVLVVVEPVGANVAEGRFTPFRLSQGSGIEPGHAP